MNPTPSPTHQEPLALPLRIASTETNGHGGWSIYDANKTHVATVYADLIKAPRKDGEMWALPDNAKSISAARQIITACNSFPALKAACEATLRTIDTVRAEMVGGCRDLTRLESTVEKALALAGKGEGRG